MNSKFSSYSFVLALVLSLFFIVAKASIFVGVGLLFFIFCVITKEGNKNSILFLFLLFTYYAVVYAYTERAMKITYVEQLTQLGPQFLMASLFAAAITTKEELFSSIKYLTYVLFVSFVVLGFYQYFTQSLLVSWVNEKDVAVYQATYDLQRFTSITEMDPANTANGIMFVIILLMEKAFERKIDAIILITAALAALLDLYTNVICSVYSRIRVLFL